MLTESNRLDSIAADAGGTGSIVCVREEAATGAATWAVVLDTEEEDHLGGGGGACVARAAYQSTCRVSPFCHWKVLSLSSAD